MFAGRGVPLAAAFSRRLQQLAPARRCPWKQPPPISAHQTVLQIILENPSSVDTNPECPFVWSRSATVLTSCNPPPPSSTSAASTCRTPAAASAATPARTGWIVLMDLSAAVGMCMDMQLYTRPTPDIRFSSASVTCLYGATLATATSRPPSYPLSFTTYQTQNTTYLPSLSYPLQFPLPTLYKFPPCLPLPLPLPLHQAKRAAAAASGI